MITTIGKGILNERMGNKAKNLVLMKKAGFRVPDGIILDADEYDCVMRENGRENEIASVIKKTTEETIAASSEKICALFSQMIVPESIKSAIVGEISEDKKYAVRSSGTKEDLEAFSFAGQYDTVLNVQGIDQVTQAILTCYRSMFSQVMLSYLVHNGIETDDLKMSVVIQEMVPSDYSGIAFGVNPTTGNDKEMVLEVARGLGENLVSGKVVPSRFCYDWFAEKFTLREDSEAILSEEELNELIHQVVEIQKYFGFPCDIEYAFYQKELYILQARAITRIKYSGIRDIWTTADFKDGGVSATVCYPYMWSLYEYIWEFIFEKFILDSKILRPKDTDKKLGDMFYGRPYWNLSVAKKAMASVPGYKEREFDQEYGVRITYEGDGETTGITLPTIIRIAEIALAQHKILKERNENAEAYKADLLGKYEQYKLHLSDTYSREELEQTWYTLTHRDYMQSECTYFWQIFINTIHQTLYKDSLLKYVTETEYLSLLGGIDRISHLLPFYDMWETTRKIRADKEAYAFFTQNDETEITGHLQEDHFYLSEIRDFIRDYGYHSEKELDVSYPCYCEDVKAVVKMYRDTVMLDDSCSPIQDKERQRNLYKEQLDRIKQQVSAGKYKKISKKVTNMRKMLWWREEYKDISTRFYYIIRAYTLLLAKQYVADGILSEESDIWFLKVADLWSFIDHKYTQEDLQTIIGRNRLYYQCYRNYLSDNEIGCVFDEEDRGAKKAKDGYFGIGCNSGIITATARVIESLDDIDRLQVGDILVTRYTDTGWTSKFAMLGGIVTESGGILCHAAIVSREYGIPCIVCAHDIMKHIKDGSTITINGTTGEILKVEGK